MPEMSGFNISHNMNESECHGWTKRHQSATLQVVMVAYIKCQAFQ